jgi:hypothetical protein
MKQYNNFSNQLLPIILTIITFFILSFLLFLFLSFLNLFPLQSSISLILRPGDIFVGLTIYIKTAIDFALFIGTLMHKNPGVKNRIAVELGTSLGNGIGTLVILTIWIFFKEIPVLLILMIFVAALVLLRMAEDGLKDYFETPTLSSSLNKRLHKLLLLLAKINNVFDPILGKLLPKHENQGSSYKTFWPLFFFALTIPFLLGLDDFAGYIPLFSIVNVFGFAIGVFLGHMLLTAALFASPQKTTKFVRMPIILVLGSFVFLGLSLWGFVEVGKGILQLLH